MDEYQKDNPMKNRGGCSHYRLFGGDAAKQRAEWYANHIDASIYRLIDDISPMRWGLNAYAQDIDGTQYSHVVVKWKEP